MLALWAKVVGRKWPGKVLLDIFFGVFVGWWPCLLFPKQPGIVARDMFACPDGEGACLLDDFRAQFSEEAAAAVRLVHNCA